MKKKIGKKVRLTTFVSEEVYAALQKMADPEDEDRWEARILRRIINSYISTVNKPPPKQIADTMSHSVDVVRPPRRKSGEGRGSPSR